MIYQAFLINQNLYHPRLFYVKNAKIQQQLRWTAAILDAENLFLILGPHC